MPPLSPQIKNLRGPRESAPYAKRSFDRKGDKNIALAKGILKSTTITTFFNNISRTNIVRDKGLEIKTIIVNDVSMFVNFYTRGSVILHAVGGG